MDPNMYRNLFLIWYLCILTLITRKLQVIYRHSTYRMTALLSKMSIFLGYNYMQDTIGKLWIQTHITTSFQYICTYLTRNLKTTGCVWMFTYQVTVSKMSVFCIRSACEIWLANYGSKHASQFLSDNPFVCPYKHTLKTTSYIWMIIILNHCSTIGDIPCVVYSCKRYSTGELLPQTSIGCSLIQHCVCILQARIYIAIGCALRMTTKPTYLMTACYTLNDSFTANNASFYMNKVG